MLRKLCRKSKDGHTCHRMAGHAPPHIERHWSHPGYNYGGCWCNVPETRWYDEVEFTKLEAVNG